MKSRASSARPHLRGRALLRQLFAEQPAHPPAATTTLAPSAALAADAPSGAQPALDKLTALAWLNGFRVDAPAEPSFAPASKRTAERSTTDRDATRPLVPPPRAR